MNMNIVEFSNDSAAICYESSRRR